MSKIITIFIVLVLVACSSNHDVTSTTFDSKNQNIIGGTQVTATDPIANFTVGLYDKENMFMCTGTLIRQNLILTAGHCIETKPSNLVIIFSLNFGALDSNQVALLRIAESIHVHPDFSMDDENAMDVNDIALIEFDGDLPEGYKPAEFLKDADLLQRNSPVHMAGYGATSVEIEEVTKRDKKFKKDVANGDVVCTDDEQTECFRIEFKGEDKLFKTDTQIEGFTEKEIRLNENEGHGTCVGDSGGPLMFEHDGQLFIVGVTSRGDLFCSGPAVYTNALKYTDWVEQVAAGLQ